MSSKKIEHYFPLFLLVGVVFGFLFPQWFHTLEPSVINLIMLIIGVLFLKLDLVDVFSHFKRPFLMLYVCMVNLILIPAVMFFVFQHVSPDLAKGIFLLSCLPAGVSAAVFSDIIEARTGMSMTVFILSNILSVFTIPFMFFVFYNQDLGIDHSILMKVHLKIICYPFLIAMTIRYFMTRLRKTSVVKVAENTLNAVYNLLILSSISLMMMIAIAHDADYIKANVSLHIKTVVVLFLCFMIFQSLSYLSVFWLKKGEKLAISTSKMVMNNILGIVLALAFFNEEVVTVVILSLIPWSVMIVLKHWYKKYLP